MNVSKPLQSAESPRPASRFLSEDESRALNTRAQGMITGGGITSLYLDSEWSGHLRWAKNEIMNSTDRRNNYISIVRNIRGAWCKCKVNQIDDRHLLQTIQRAERGVEKGRESPYNRQDTPFIEPYLQPKLWFESTYAQDAAERGEIVRSLIKSVADAGMVAAGYTTVAGAGHGTLGPEHIWYYPYTAAQFSVTVRDPEGKGSGWAGVDWNDWTRIDTQHLSQVALDKCLRSRNPSAVEPGRYTTILEPQAVGDLLRFIFNPIAMDREWAEVDDPANKKDSGYFNRPYPYDSPFRSPASKVSKIGAKVIDERFTVRSDPMDPDLGFLPFRGWQVYHPVTWIADGILKELAYYRKYAVQRLGLDTGGLPFYGDPDALVGAFRVSWKGETASIDDMIRATKRGVLVTRFSNIERIDWQSLLLSGYTRDGLWLIENGKISKPIKNFKFTESPLFALNNVEQCGVSERIFNPGFPVVVPALRVRDFNFSALSDAI